MMLLREYVSRMAYKEKSARDCEGDMPPSRSRRAKGVPLLGEPTPVFDGNRSSDIDCKQRMRTKWNPLIYLKGQ